MTIEPKTKDLPTLFVLSVATGRNMEDRGISGVYQVLNWMTGEQLFTHQLPRVGREAAPVLLAALPQLQAAVDDCEVVFKDADKVDVQAFNEYRERWVKTLGETLPVPKLNHTQHERIDAMSEAAEKFRPDQIIPIVPGKAAPK